MARAKSFVAAMLIVTLGACDETREPGPEPRPDSAPRKAAVLEPTKAPVATDEHELEFRDQIVASSLENLRAIAASPEVITAVIEANAAGHKDQAEILAIDKQWRQAASAEDPLIAPFLANHCALFLKQVQKDHPNYCELFVMDDQGSIVAESNKTSDYWQGDEAKWIESFHGGQGRLFIDDIEYDQSTQAFVVQISLPVNAPDGATLGALTVGVLARKQP